MQWLKATSLNVKASEVLKKLYISLLGFDKETLSFLFIFLLMVILTSGIFA